MIRIFMRKRIKSINRKITQLKYLINKKTHLPLMDLSKDNSVFLESLQNKCLNSLIVLFKDMVLLLIIQLTVVN